MTKAANLGMHADEESLMELNRVERRALLVSTALVVLGVALRIGVGPGAATWAWRSAGPGGDLDSTRARVEREIARAERIATPLADGETLDPNSAPEEELQRLPGVGPSKAAAILAARAAGPFRAAEDLARVPGLGPVTIERLRPFLSFPAAPSALAPALPHRAPDVPTADPSVATLDLNEAEASALEALPGLGPARASAIVRHRIRHGPFRSLEELTSVPGIGPGLLSRLRPYLRVR